MAQGDKELTPPRRSVRIVGLLLMFLLPPTILSLFLFLVALYAEIGLPVVAQNRRPLLSTDIYRHSPTLGWKIAPDLAITLTSRDNTRSEPYFTSDAKGFRRSRPAPPGRGGILLGDSQVQGYFLKDEETLPWRLSELLGIPVHNGGIGGYSTDQELLLLEETREELAWAGVILYANDLPKNLSREAWDLFKPRFAIVDGRVDFATIEPPRFNERLESQADKDSVCCLYDGVQLRKQVGENFLTLFNTLRWTPGKFPGTLAGVASLALGKSRHQYQLDETFYRQPESRQLEFTVLFQLLTRMQAIMTARNGRFFVVYLPELAQLLGDPGLRDGPQRHFLEGCRRLGLECWDPTAEFIAEQRREALFFMDDDHLSPHGAAFLANYLKGRIGSG
ncbi:MAG: SGNH/GDSL hydrolase family protein [Magnetococcales bacterium]|nr:SGNH/GDSL hydrolase family protein [Magnetococcales bacterium]